MRGSCVALLLSCGAVIGCSQAARSTQPPSPSVNPGDRLLLVLEGKGKAGGTATLAAQGAAPLALTGFDAPAGLKVTPDFQSEVYFLSDPLTADELQIGAGVSDYGVKLSLDATVSSGSLVKDGSGNVRAYAAVWQKTGTGVQVTRLADLGRPVHLGGTP
jgi:hypothetical protein